ncbi:PREDICTED: protein RALF-like 18 [Camelina sativa]|uniref:Protein RALF-like 18 n=1 Tax=Camelina sativa TaxID=90675 RepID=A0ABM0Y370_CAMSA|nr:PREDICTED: protein RALF-like 18 [Camelina sativa]
MMNDMKFLMIIAVVISASLFPALVFGSRPVKCDNCIDSGEEKITMMKKMRSSLDLSRRILQASRYINYDAMKQNKPAKPDGKPDQSDNTYRRGCTAATECHRFTN